MRHSTAGLARASAGRNRKSEASELAPRSGPAMTIVKIKELPLSGDIR
jgi:hypothetical protein